MNVVEESLFYSKILLFGEYGIIEDSMGLSIPFDSYSGKFQNKNTTSPKAKKSNKHLNEFCDFLEEQIKNKALSFKIDVKRFREDIDSGIYFESNIPEGYGVGSSGALCAAVYNNYGINKIDAENNITSQKIVKLKKIFSEMESYFHGKSSGLDPLICYLKLPILIKSKSDINTVGLPEKSSGKSAIFLLNSGKPGKTQPMVNIFLEKLKEDGFRNMIKKEFKKYNDACIESFLKKDISPLFDNIKKLSNLVFDNFKPMIPEVFHKLWKEGIESNSYYLKLCGSGGGGYILGFTQNIDLAKSKLKDYQIEVVYNF